MEPSTEKEILGMKRLQELIEDFLDEKQGSEEVREFISNIANDEDLRFRFLKGRKLQPERAFETMKRLAEVRFKQYPEVFSNEIPALMRSLQDRGILGILKNRDSDGRRIVCFNAAQWDTKEFNLTDMTHCGTCIMRTLIYDNDALTNGVVLIKNCENMGLSHAKNYTFHNMMRLINVFWNACPLMYKAIYFVNLPYSLFFLYEMMKPFLPKKLKERFHVTSYSKKFKEIHEEISPDLLPKFLGGSVENKEAFDKTIIVNSNLK